MGTTTSSGPYWGIDLGGTKIEGAVVPSASDTEVLCRLRVDTEADQGYEHIVDQVGVLVERMEEVAGPRPSRIGIGHPGVVDPTTQLLKNSNTQCMNGKPIKADLERKLGVKVEMMNDANCFALAEALLGAGKGGSVVFGVIMGTGVGGGIVIDGKALYGAQGIAGEWGHNVLDPEGPQCYCGKRGCVETLLSGPSLQRYYSEKWGEHVSMPEIMRRYERGGDPHAIETVDRLVTNFGKAIAYIINILDPHYVVLGGGLSNIPLLYTRGIEEAAKSVFNNRFETKIVKHKLGDSAGVFGAAMLTVS